MLLGAAALALLAACSRDGLDHVQGEPLPPGQYPLELTAGGLQAVITSEQASTRATVDDDWNDVTTVAVQVGNEVRQYSTTSADGGTTATLSSDNPFYWENTSEKKTVTAWHPYSDAYPVAWTVKADQSTAESYQASDLIKGELQDLAFADRDNPAKNKMTFSHQTAKVAVNLVAVDGVTLDEGTAVKLLNVGGLESGTMLTPYKPDNTRHTYLAVLNGQTIAANVSFIQVATGGNTFLYKAQTSKTLQAGTAYTYNITVKANGIEVTEATGGEWTDGGSEDIAGKEKSYTASELKLGDYYYSDGTTSDGGLRKHYSDGTKVMENPKPAPVSGKTVIGIVFHTGQHSKDQSDYTGSGIGQKNCHGYVVALSDATTETNFCRWGKSYTKLNLYIDNYTDPDIDWNGYYYTQTIINHIGGKDKLDADDESGYPATYYAVVAYENNCPAPAGSSGWFLPSIGQMRKVYQQRDLLTSVVGNSGLKDDNYWSSSEYYGNPELDALYVNVPNDYVGGWPKYSRECLVRAVLAF